MTETKSIARCYQCDWTTEGDRSDRSAEAHTRQTGHTTSTTTTPVTHTPRHAEAKP